MSYIKTTWVTGDIVTAPRMNNMEGGIYNNDAAITALQSEVTDTQSDVSTLQSNVSTLQTNVTNLQTITGNLVPSIADVFSTSSTYAVGDHVMYNGRLYECKTAVTSAGAWNASAWEAVSVFKYDDVVGVIKITNTSTTMATIETTLAEINTANDHIVFDVSALSAGMHLCTIYLSDGKYRITDLATGFDGEGLYSGTDTLVSILQKGSASFYNVSTEPYTFRPINAGIGDKESLDSIVGGSLGWNQLVHNLTSRSAVQGITRTVSSDGTSMTYTGTATTTDNYTAFAFYPVVGHKYLMTLGNVTLPTGAKIVGATQDKATSILVNITTSAYSLGITINSGVVCNFTIQPMAIDLTAMFGTTIADYIYSLESSAAGSGIAWLRKYIDIDSYHAYDAGSIQSVQATAHVTTGFNQFDEVVEAGYWDASTGQKASGGNWMRCANYIPVLPNTEYKIHFTSGSGSQGNIIYLDGNKSVISYAASYISAVITTPSNCRYIVFYANSGWFGGNICINISRTTGTPKNGDYVPYTTYTYPLGSDTLRGTPQLVNNKLAFDGDIKTPDGTTRRRYGTVDLGTLNWGYATNYGGAFYANLPSEVANTVTGGLAGVCGRYALFQGGASEFTNADKVFTLCNQNFTSLKRIQLKDSAYTDQATFKASVSGVYLVYPLATETTESSTAYQRVQEASQGGTEAFITNTIVPVGHSTRNPGNMLAAVELVGDDKEEDPIYSEDSTPYTLRKVESRGVAGKESLEKLIGGSLGWNQLIYGDFADTTHWGGTRATIAVSGGVMTGTCDTTGFVTLNSNLPTSVQNHKVAILFDFKSSLSSIYLRGSVSNSSINTNTFLGKTYTGATSWASVSAVYMPTQNGASQLRIGADMTAGDTLSLRNAMFIDLTTMFGSTIADYVYGLEQATTGSGVAWLSQYIDLGTYHAYDAGSIQSVQATAHVTTGKNLLENTTATQTTNGITFTRNADGSVTANGTATTNAQYIIYFDTSKIYGNLYFNGVSGGSSSTYQIYMWDSTDGSRAKKWNGTTNSGDSVNLTTLQEVKVTQGHIVTFVCRVIGGITVSNVRFYPMMTYPSNTDPTYEPYTAHTYPLGSDTLRGIPQLVSNKLAYDGDIKTPDGTIKRRYGIANINDFTFTYDSTNKWLMGSSALPNSISSTTAMPNSMTDMPYDAVAANTLNVNTKAWTLYTGKVVVKDSSLTEAQLRAAISGKHIVYPLATETTESSTSYQKIQTIDADGTESFTTSTPVPVGHYTQYAENILAEIDAIGDGLDDIGEEKAVQIPNSAITFVESGASIVENGLHIYKNMVSGWLVIKRGTGYAQTSSHIATIDSRYIPKTRQRMVAGEGYNAYDMQGVAYATIPPQGDASAGQLWATQNSTSRPHLFIHLDYTI